MIVLYFLQDRDHCVTVYTKQLVVGGSGDPGEGGEGEEEEEEETVTWEFMAKYRSHYQPIESKTLFTLAIYTHRRGIK